MTEIDRYHLYGGVFQPLREDDLQFDAREWIGHPMEFVPAWFIEDGPYAGQWAFTPRRHEVRLGWVPACDITDLAPLKEEPAS